MPALVVDVAFTSRVDFLEAVPTEAIVLLGRNDNAVLLFEGEDNILIPAKIVADLMRRNGDGLLSTFNVSLTIGESSVEVFASGDRARISMTGYEVEEKSENPVLFRVSNEVQKIIIRTFAQLKTT